MARLRKNSYPLPNLTNDGDFNKSPHMVAFDKLRTISDALPAGQLKGYIWKTQACDGYANYLVVADNGKSVTLQHIPFLDGYTAPAAHIRGLTRKDILIDQQRVLGWNKLISEKGK